MPIVSVRYNENIQMKGKGLVQVAVLWDGVIAKCN